MITISATQSELMAAFIEWEKKGLKEFSDDLKNATSEIKAAARAAALTNILLNMSAAGMYITYCPTTGQLCNRNFNDWDDHRERTLNLTRASIRSKKD